LISRGDEVVRVDLEELVAITNWHPSSLP
jgi:hypothetical protein